MNKKPLTYYFEFEQCGDWSNGEVPALFSYALKSLAHHGVRHIVLTDSLLALMMRYRWSWETLSHKIKAAVEAEGLDFVDTHSVYGTWLDLNEPDPARREEMVTAHCHAMALAASLGVKTITIHVGNSRIPGAAWPQSAWLDAISQVTLEQHIENATAALKRLVPYAETLEMTICIENVRYVCTTPEALLELKRRFPSEALGFCYDAGHANIVESLYRASDMPSQRAMAENTSIPLSLQILDQMLPHIVNCHLHDNNGVDDQHLLPGMGTLDWAGIAERLKRAPKLQCLQSEMLPVRTKTPIPVMVETFNRLFGDFAE